MGIFDQKTNKNINQREFEAKLSELNDGLDKRLSTLKSDVEGKQKSVKASLAEYVKLTLLDKLLEDLNQENSESFTALDNKIDSIRSEGGEVATALERGLSELSNKLDSVKIPSIEGLASEAEVKTITTDVKRKLQRQIDSLKKELKDLPDSKSLAVVRSAISNLRDVEITEPIGDNDILVYDATAAKWKNESSAISSDELVKITASDTTTGYLDAKLVEGTGITTTVLNPGASETLEVSVNSTFLDGEYLRLDTTNDPLTGDLTLAEGTGDDSHTLFFEAGSTRLGQIKQEGADGNGEMVFQTNGGFVWRTDSVDRITVGGSVGTVFSENSASTFSAGLFVNNIGTGDPKLTFNADSQNASIGIDNSDSNKLKISMSQDVAGSAAITIDTALDVEIVAGDLLVTAGNVGIGIDTPLASLHVPNGSTTILGLNTSSVTAGGVAVRDNFRIEDEAGNVRFQVSGGSVSFGANGGSTFVSGYSGPARFNVGALSSGSIPMAIRGVSGQTGDLFRVDISGTSTGEAFLIDASGNVGVGTSSPVSLLHVSSGTSGDAVLTLESDTDNSNEDDNPYVFFNQDSGLVTGGIGLTNVTKPSGGGTVLTNGLLMWNDFAAGSITHMIGTTKTLQSTTSLTNIYQALDVASNVSATSFITDGGASTDFVKGNGSLDSTTYAPAADYVPYTGATTGLNMGSQSITSTGSFSFGGGNLDGVSFSSGNITIADSAFILFGAGIDLTLTSDGTDGIIESYSGTSDLDFKGFLEYTFDADVYAGNDLFVTSAVSAPTGAFDEYYDVNGSSQWGSTDGSGNFTFATGNTVNIDFISSSNTQIEINSVIIDGASGGDTTIPASLTLQNGTSINEFSTDGTLAGNSDDAAPTEKAVKTYIDTGFVPYTGATGDVDLGSNSITAEKHLDNGWATHTITGNGDTIVHDDYATVHAKGTLTGASGNTTEVWSVDIAAGSYDGQQLTLVLEAEANATGIFATVDFKLIATDIQRATSAFAFAFPSVPTVVSGIERFDLVWDGSGWKTTDGLSENAWTGGGGAWACGTGNTSSGGSSITAGIGNVASVLYCGAFGSQNNVSSSMSFAFGGTNIISATGTQNFAAGSGNQMTGTTDKSVVFGGSNTMSSGGGSLIAGTGNAGSGGISQYILGLRNTVTESEATIIGTDNTVNGVGTSIIGSGLTASGTDSHVIGTGGGSFSETEFHIITGLEAWLETDSKKYYFGAAKDASVTYNGTDFILKPDEVGSGKLIVDGGLTTTGGRKVNTDRYTANQTLDADNHQVFCNTDGGAFTITLPAGIDGTEYQINNTGSSNLTVVPNGSDTIRTFASIIIAPGNSKNLVFETTEKWW